MNPRLLHLPPGRGWQVKETPSHQEQVCSVEPGLAPSRLLFSPPPVSSVAAPQDKRRTCSENNHTYQHVATHEIMHTNSLQQGQGSAHAESDQIKRKPMALSRHRGTRNKGRDRERGWCDRAQASHSTTACLQIFLTWRSIAEVLVTSFAHADQLQRCSGSSHSRRQRCLKD